MPKRGYHHGNLRAALIEAALELISGKGPQGFTLAEAAKRAGVSPAAVYRHFDGREALIVEIAQQGFDRFADLLEHAWDEGRPVPLAALDRVGRAYLAFARRYPGHYVAMFESGVQPLANADLARASDRAGAVLTRAAQALSAHIPPHRRPPPEMFSAHIRAFSHGIVELYARGKPGACGPFSADDLLETGVGIYLRGLGLIDPDP